MKKIFKIILVGCILSFLVGVIGVFGIVNHYKKELPNIAELIESYSPSIPTRVYDINGKQIDELYKEIRIPARIEEIPMASRNAFLAIEDRRFYSHYGIDPIGILRAIVINIRYKSARQGASTFTQQLARNAFLSHDKKLSRKIKEAILTIEIEKTYTKDEIFEKYLNEIYFGEGDYGIKSAAKSLFHKDISDINIPEAAVLAGIPNRPRYYNPRRNLKASLNRMRVVLSQMKKFNMITKEEYEIAMKHKFVKIDDVKDMGKIDLKNTTIIYNREVINKSLAPSFTDLVHDYLIENFDEEAIYNDGLQVYTTLNFDMQKIAEETFDNYKPMIDDKKLQGGMITINSSNGYITSIVGGKNFKPRNFNRAIMANRQIGSSFKPFVYFTAILDGKSENTIIEDSRLVQGNWAPRNYGTLFRKNITLVEGLNRSINMVAIKLLKGVGFNKLFDVVGKLDSNLNPPRDLTAALGSVSSSPLNLAKAYSVFSNGGYVVEPLVVIEVKDKNGNTLIKNTPKIKKVFDAKDIALTTNLLENSVESGTSTRAKVVTKRGERISQGGKTGTTNDSRSVWYAGITPEYATTVYLGYDDNSKMYKKTGGGLAAPIWREYYKKIIDEGYYAPSKFEFIDNLVLNGELYYQNLGALSGLRESSKTKRKFLLKNNRVELEKEDKYNKNIQDILYK